MIRINQGESPIEIFILRRIIFPDLIIMTMLLCLEFVHKYTSYRNENIIISVSILIAFTLVASISPEISGTPAILIIPLLISIAYFNRFMLMVSVFSGILFLAALLLFSPAHRAEINVFEIILIVGLLLGGFITGIGILHRCTELLKNMESLVKSEQKLMVENALIGELLTTYHLTMLEVGASKSFLGNGTFFDEGWYLSFHLKAFLLSGNPYSSRMIHTSIIPHRLNQIGNTFCHLLP